MAENIYIACPYGHDDHRVRAARVAIAGKVAGDLARVGFRPFAPIVYGHHMQLYSEFKGSQIFWIDFCLEILEMCHEMVVLRIPGWEKSDGVQREIEFAENVLKIPVRYMDIPGFRVEEMV